jgi:tetrahydromethanopterin S-methyltransferase subunit G
MWIQQDGQEDPYIKIVFVADTTRDREMLDKFQLAYENLKKIADRLEDENRKLSQELEEYKKRHPSNIGVKNGKTYDIVVSWDAQPENIIHEMQG